MHAWNKVGWAEFGWLMLSVRREQADLARVALVLRGATAHASSTQHAQMQSSTQLARLAHPAVPRAAPADAVPLSSSALSFQVENVQRMIDEKRQRAAAARKPFLVVHPGEHLCPVLWLLLVLVMERCCCCCCGVSGLKWMLHCSLTAHRAECTALAVETFLQTCRFAHSCGLADRYLRAMQAATPWLRSRRQPSRRSRQRRVTSNPTASLPPLGPLSPPPALLWRRRQRLAMAAAGLPAAARAPAR